MYKLLVFLCFSVGLFADVAYDVVLLAPEGEELVHSNYLLDTNRCLNEAGYVWGSSLNSTCAPFVYHKDLGFKIVPIPLNGYESVILGVNKNGVSVGVVKNIDEGVTSQKIFVYEMQTGVYYHLLEHFNCEGEEDYSLDGSQIRGLMVSDASQIFFQRSSDLSTYIYDLNKRTVSIFNKGTLYAGNAKGQIIGIDSFGSWFFDSNTFHSLGSLDKFKRWAVNSKALSQNGYVVGEGLNSFGEEKLFTWHLQQGLREVDPPSNNFRVWADAINNNGQIIGDYEAVYKAHSDSEYHAFIICPEVGFIDLGTPGITSCAYSINNHGQVVGNYEPRREYEKKAFIWDIKEGTRELSTLISQENTGWKELEEVNAINDSGYIAGRGKYYGVEQCFLLIPKN